MLNNINSDSKRQIAVSSANKINIINEEDIVCLLADGNYTEVIVVNDNKIISTKPLKYFNSIFDSHGDFFRVSKSSIVNKKSIKSFDKSSNTILLSNGSSLEVSRRRKKDFIDELNLI